MTEPPATATDAPSPVPEATPAPPTASPTEAAPTPSRPPAASTEPTVAGPSALEEKQALAESLRPYVKEIDGDARVVDGLFARYIARCYDRFSGRRWADRGVSRKRHEWLFVPLDEFAWQDRWVMPFGGLELGIEPQRCRDDWADLYVEGASVGQALEELQDRARRLGVLPGHLRALLEEHGLER